jgi:hypothetical protein
MVEMAAMAMEAREMWWGLPVIANVRALFSFDAPTRRAERIMGRHKRSSVCREASIRDTIQHILEIDPGWRDREVRPVVVHIQRNAKQRLL